MNTLAAGLLLFTSLVLYAQDSATTAATQRAASYCGPVLVDFHTIGSEPTLVHRVGPKYPKEARRAKLEGDVRLVATIGTDGTVKGIKILSGEQVLANAAIEAVKQWRYQPAVANGAAVEVPTEITVKFALPGHDKKQGSGQSPDTSDQALLPTHPATDDAAEPEQVYAVGDNVKPPKAIYHPNATYPDSARKAGRQGTVLLAVIVSPEGNVRDVEVCRNLDPTLDQQATQTVSQWKFQPATKDGKPVAVHISVEVSFHLYQ